MLYALTAFLLLLLVILHEVGHMVAAQRCGVKVEEFCIGMGPRICSFSVRGIRVSVKLFPMGDSCEMDTETYEALPLRKKVIILSAGCIINFLAGCVLTVLALVMANGLVAGLQKAPMAVGSFLILPFQALSCLKGVSLEKLGGPVQLVTEVSHMASEFAVPVAGVFAVMAIISFLLSIFNLLPIPPLDGGEIVYSIISRVFGRNDRAYRLVCGLVWGFMIWVTGVAFINDAFFLL